MIFTFYSYKGGVGRSMILANIAELFYQDGLKVLMIDWDLEAPGLEQYFPIDQFKQKDVLNRRGLFDLILSYKERMSHEMTEEEPLNLEEPKDFMIDIYPTKNQKGKLYLLTAGRRAEKAFSTYSQSVVSFDWVDFFENWEGERYFEWLRRKFEDIADVILIDSRTGVTEISGISTYQMADSVIMCCAPNHQNLHGIHEMARRLALPKLYDLRKNRPLDVIIIPSRVERSDTIMVNKFKKLFLTTFKDISFPMEIDVEQLWSLGITYYPPYALTELVAIRDERQSSNAAHAEKLAIEIRNLGAVLQQIKEGDNGLLTVFFRNNGIQINHFKFNKFGQLTELSISGQALTSLPPEIAQFTSLRILDLKGNQLSTIPRLIDQLTKLTTLSLSGNQLKEIPEWLVAMPQLEKLQIQQNPITQPPPELLETALTAKTSENAYVNLKTIRHYYAQQAIKGEAYFYEAKLILIGEGGAGKTSLARKLLNPANSLPTIYESTEGIDIHQWQFDIPPHFQSSDLGSDSLRYTVNIWDIGGQSVYHATHQFFLSNRAVYILLADTRRENDRFYDWLQMQEAFGGNSPVLLLKNKNRQHGSQCVIENLPHLRDLFPNLVDEIVEVDLSRVPDDPHWGDLLRYLQRYLLTLEHIGQPFPKTWVAIRNALKADGRNSISYTQYLTLCRQHGIDDEVNALQLSQFLHDIGDILHYQQDNGALRDLIILNAEWALAAVYRILDDEQINNRWGQFSYNDLRQLWHEDEYDGHTSQLLALMETFQLCYPLPNQPHHYIAPQLLKPNAPTYTWEFHPDDLRLHFHYPRFMPRGILGRAIAKLHDKIEAQDTVWRSGVILARYHARAKLLELRGEKEIRISVSGKRRRDFLMEIVNTIDSLHDGFSNKLEYEKRVPCRCETCQQAGDGQHFFSMELLLKYRDKGIPTIRCGVSLDEVDTRGLIDDAILYMDRRGGDVHNIYGDYVGDDNIKTGDIDDSQGVEIGRDSNATTTQS